MIGQSTHLLKAIELAVDICAVMGFGMNIA
jgi:hypothetical protein